MSSDEELSPHSCQIAAKNKLLKALILEIKGLFKKVCVGLGEGDEKKVIEHITHPAFDVKLKREPLATFSLRHQLFYYTITKIREIILIKMNY